MGGVSTMFATRPVVTTERVADGACLLVDVLRIALDEHITVSGASIGQGAAVLRVRDDRAASRLCAAVLLRMTSPYLQTERTRTPFGWRLVGLDAPGDVHAVLIETDRTEGASL